MDFQTETSEKLELNPEEPKVLEINPEINETRELNVITEREPLI